MTSAMWCILFTPDVRIIVTIIVLVLSITHICVWNFIAKCGAKIPWVQHLKEEDQSEYDKHGHAKLTHSMFMKAGILSESKKVKCDYKSQYFDFLTRNSDKQAAFTMRQSTNVPPENTIQRTIAAKRGTTEANYELPQRPAHQ